MRTGWLNKITLFYSPIFKNNGNTDIPCSTGIKRGLSSSFTHNWLISLIILSGPENSKLPILEFILSERMNEQDCM